MRVVIECFRGSFMFSQTFLNIHVFVELHVATSVQLENNYFINT